MKTITLRNLEVWIKQLDKGKYGIMISSAPDPFLRLDCFYEAQDIYRSVKKFYMNLQKAQDVLDEHNRERTA